jgi:tRNA threonylcarbamoyladenosine biosynthesis protein TsaB
MILAIKTDAPEAYIALFQDGQEKAAKRWEAGRELSMQLLSTIESLCDECSTTISEIKGIIVFQGPGSYTGLRIGITTANAIGNSFNMQVIGAEGDSWLNDGLDKLKYPHDFTPVTPIYGGDVYTTKPRK